MLVAVHVGAKLARDGDFTDAIAGKPCSYSDGDFMDAIAGKPCSYSDGDFMDAIAGKPCSYSDGDFTDAIAGKPCSYSDGDFTEAIASKLAPTEVPRKTPTDRPPPARRHDSPLADRSTGY